MGLRKSTEEEIEILWKSAGEKNSIPSMSESPRVIHSDDESSVATERRKVSFMKKMKAKQNAKRSKKKNRRRVKDSSMDDSKHIILYNLRVSEPSGTESKPTESAARQMSTKDDVQNDSGVEIDENESKSSRHAEPPLLTRKSLDLISSPSSRPEKYDEDFDSSGRTMLSTSSADSEPENSDGSHQKTLAGRSQMNKPLTIMALE